MMQKSLFSLFLGSVFLIVACSPKKELTVPGLVPEFLAESNNEFSGKLFFIGPDLDSVNASVVAECDCCASDLAFINDSVFLYVELCLGGDVYIKGKYRTFGNLLILQTDEEILSSEYEYAETSGVDFPTRYEIIKQKTTYHAYVISDLKGKQLITYRKNDLEEYGMVTSGSITHLLDEIRQEKPLREYLDN
ncbi:hypothetical protein D3C86_1579570 [compost metagenome]